MTPEELRVTAVQIAIRLAELDGNPAADNLVTSSKAIYGFLKDGTP